MTEKEKAASYTIICLMEDASRRKNKSETSLSPLFEERDISKIKDRKYVRMFRNCLVHYPRDFVELYRYLSKYERAIRLVPYKCVKLVDWCSQSEVDESIKVLLRFYKSAKEEM